VKVKVKMSLCLTKVRRHEDILYLTKHHAMKTYGGMEVYLQEILTSALDGGEWLAPCSRRFPLGECGLPTHWIGDCVGPIAGLYAVAKKIPSPPVLGTETRSSSL